MGSKVRSVGADPARRRDDALRRALATRPKPHKDRTRDKDDSKPSPKAKPTRHAKASDR